MTTDYLQRALEIIGASEADVLAHSVSVDGQAYVVVISPGPKYRVPLVELDALEEAKEATAEKHPLYDLSYRELQAVAKNFSIPANQSADDLIAAILGLEAAEEEE